MNRDPTELLRTFAVASRKRFRDLFGWAAAQLRLRAADAVAAAQRCENSGSACAEHGSPEAEVVALLRDAAELLRLAETFDGAQTLKFVPVSPQAIDAALDAEEEKP